MEQKLLNSKVAKLGVKFCQFRVEKNNTGLKPIETSNELEIPECVFKLKL